MINVTSNIDAALPSGTGPLGLPCLKLILCLLSHPPPPRRLHFPNKGFGPEGEADVVLGWGRCSGRSH